MFARIIECGDEGALVGAENTSTYARLAERFKICHWGFLRHLETLKVGHRYLEIGPGPAVLTAEIARRRPDAHITGVDLSPEMVTIGRGTIARAGMADRVRLLVGDAGDEDVIGSLGEFDLIYSTFSLHHWDDPKAVIRNLMSVLSDDGAIYIHDLRRAWLMYLVPSDFGFWKSIRASYLRQDIHDMLDELGITRYQVWNVFPCMQSIQIWK